MAYYDSLDKIVQVYLACVTKEPIEYKNRIFYPRRLSVSPNLVRTFICPSMCGGCCLAFTMDYLPGECARHLSFRQRAITVNRREFNFETLNTPQNHQLRTCPHMNLQDGRCQIYEHRAFSCKFEPIRFRMSTDPGRPHYLGTTPFGRGWSYTRITGVKGAACLFTNNITLHTINAAFERVLELKRWADYFQIEHRVEQILEIIDAARHGKFTHSYII